MSLIPRLFGGKPNPYYSYNPYNPIYGPIWDPEECENIPVFADTRIDRRETPEAYIFQANIPGLRKEDVKVEVEVEKVLQISGRRSYEERNDRWYRVERSGEFQHRFRLPENARVEQAWASMDNGALTVTVPKGEENANLRGIKIY